MESIWRQMSPWFVRNNQLTVLQAKLAGQEHTRLLVAQEQVNQIGLVDEEVQRDRANVPGW
ncbi:MAG: hypothetical protein ACRCXC_10850 [Legionella sp.]